MYSSPKMPRSYLAFTASDMMLGDRAFFQEGCMELDPEGSGWIHPFSEPVKRTFDIEEIKKSHSEGLILERVQGGFSVDLSAIMVPCAWRRGPKPEPIYGVEWIPVVEFVVPGDQPPG